MLLKTEIWLISAETFAFYVFSKIMLVIKICPGYALYAISVLNYRQARGPDEVRRIVLKFCADAIRIYWHSHLVRTNCSIVSINVHRLVLLEFFSYIQHVTKKSDRSSPLNYQISCNFRFLHFLKLLTLSLSGRLTNTNLLAMLHLIATANFPRSVALAVFWLP